jgi:hypothetical protein
VPVPELSVQNPPESLQSDKHNSVLENAGYIEVDGVQIYSVIHGSTKPIARALLVGPFASERYTSYISWVHWARFLASRGIETLRFDYGGVGESTGKFEDMGFNRWSEQVEVLARGLKAQRPDLPLVLHGLELGALLAGKTFSGGVGDALLLWSLPKNANDVLRRTLWRQVFMRFSERSSFSEYIRLLEADQPLEVDGYVWSRRLWQESIAFGPAPELHSDDVGSNKDHAVKVVKLEGSGASVFSRPSMGRYVTLNPDLSDFFAQNVEWISRVLGKSSGQEKI